jgi:hypothetical protein
MIITSDKHIFGTPFVDVPNLDNTFTFDLNVFQAHPDWSAFVRPLFATDHLPTAIYRQIQRNPRRPFMLVRCLGPGHLRYTAITFKRDHTRYINTPAPPQEAVARIWGTGERFTWAALGLKTLAEQ